MFLAARRNPEGTVTYHSQYTGKQSSGSYVRVPSTGWVVWSVRGPEAAEAKNRMCVAPGLVDPGAVMSSTAAGVAL